MGRMPRPWRIVLAALGAALMAALGWWAGSVDRSMDGRAIPPQVRPDPPEADWRTPEEESLPRLREREALDPKKLAERPHSGAPPSRPDALRIAATAVGSTPLPGTGRSRAAADPVGDAILAPAGTQAVEKLDRRGSFDTETSAPELLIDDAPGMAPPAVLQVPATELPRLDPIEPPTRPES